MLFSVPADVVFKDRHEAYLFFFRRDRSNVRTSYFTLQVRSSLIDGDFCPESFI